MRYTHKVPLEERATQSINSLITRENSCITMASANRYVVDKFHSKQGLEKYNIQESKPWKVGGSECKSKGVSSVLAGTCRSKFRTLSPS